MKYLAAVVVCGIVFSGAFAGDVEVAGMKSVTPKGWKEEAPSNSMRLTQFKLPKAEGDPEDAELAVFYFKGGSGGVEANLERQVKKFKPAAGEDKVEAKTEKIKVGKIDATFQDVQGTFLSKFPPFAPNAKITEKEKYRQLYVIFTTEQGDYYMTLLGPAKTIEKHKKDFQEFLTNFK
ncbi:hypothetical protein [Zavarzinella formosa]|uniref:hypothetical protein n=1 Tax=Zavarzinella formosa TaxID=360055 RepID=UPI0002D9287C|nr:hypothetical protein [Zavarzinella formosa]